MPAPVPYSLYAFCLQTPAEAERALRELVAAKTRLLATGIEVMPRIYNYVDALNIVLGTADPADPLSQIDTNTIRTLDASLIKQFVDKPEDKVTRDAVSMQLVLIYAALGLMTDVKPYTPAELVAIINKEADIYNDEIFVHTLRQALDGEQMETLVPILLTVLDRQAKEQTTVLYDWYGAVLYVLLLQTVWHYFRYLQPADQELLLKNYFYQSIVGGASVRAALERAFEDLSAEETNALYTTCVQAIDKNVEQVVLQAPVSGRPFADVLKSYRGRHGDDPNNGFGQEQFAQEFYQGQENRSIYSAWLREAINVALHMRAGR